MDVRIRKFTLKDIPNKVKWINDPMNNTYLHYDLPLEVEKTKQWFEKVKENDSRYDAVIEVDGESVGIIGLLNINGFNAEYYITIGNNNYRGKNVALKASQLLLKFAFEELGLQKVYLYTEQENIPMQKLAQKTGMIRETLLIDHLIRKGKFRNCFYYTITKEDFTSKIIFPTKSLSDIEFLLNDSNNNNIYMKRDDLIPFSFGGNKARKAKYFIDDILHGNYTMVVTYGSSKSNHCRVVANLCAKHNLKCIIISPKSEDTDNFNRNLIELSQVEIIESDIERVSSTIEDTLKHQSDVGEKVYFIPGGGHGNIGTKAYVDAFHEIEVWQRRNKTVFDYIFLASGTGTTQAGLVVGQLLHRRKKTKIVGISIARTAERGGKVVEESIREYLDEHNFVDIFDEDIVIFLDNYTLGGYGQTNKEVYRTVNKLYLKNGITLSATYTGKAFLGMENFIESEQVQNKNILFVNTGGVPLFFDDFNKLSELNRK